MRVTSSTRTQINKIRQQPLLVLHVLAFTMHILIWTNALVCSIMLFMHSVDDNAPNLFLLALIPTSIAMLALGFSPSVSLLCWFLIGLLVIVGFSMLALVYAIFLQVAPIREIAVTVINACIVEGLILGSLAVGRRAGYR